LSTVDGRIHAVLSLADSHGVGCHYWSESEYGVPVAQLEALGLASTIGTGIPRCELHGCHIIETCAFRVIFAEARSGRAGRKFTVSERGLEVMLAPERLATAIDSYPLAQRIRSTLAAGPLSWLELYWRLLEPDLAAIANGKHCPRPTRREVRFCLDLMIAAGLVAEDEGVGSLRLAIT
jgi:hypothetical protein